MALTVALKTFRSAIVLAAMRASRAFRSVDATERIAHLEIRARLRVYSASFEDEEFRRIIDLGIHAHIEESPEIRAAVASRLRKAADPFASRMIHAIEDVESPLRNLSLIVRTYTGYVFRRLQEIVKDNPRR